MGTFPFLIVRLTYPQQQWTLISVVSGNNSASHSTLSNWVKERSKDGRRQVGSYLPTSKVFALICSSVNSILCISLCTALSCLLPFIC